MGPGAIDYSSLFGITTGTMSSATSMGVMFEFDSRKRVELSYGKGTESDDCKIKRAQ